MLRSLLWLTFLSVVAGHAPNNDKPTMIILRELNISERYTLYIQSGEKAYPQVNLALKPVSSSGVVVVNTNLCPIFKINLEPNNVVEIVHGDVSKRFHAKDFILIRYAPDYGLWVSGQHYPSSGCYLAVEALGGFDVYPLTFETWDSASILVKEIYPDRFIRHDLTESLSEKGGGYDAPTRPFFEIVRAVHTKVVVEKKDKTWSYIVLLFPFLVGLLIGFIAIYIFVRCCWWSSDDINKPSAIKRNQKGKKPAKRKREKTKREKTKKEKASKKEKSSKSKMSKASKGSKESKSKVSKAAQSNKEKSSKASAGSSDNKESKGSKEFVKSFSLAAGESGPAYENL